MSNFNLARNLCVLFEGILSAKGWHVGLTGTSLYGEASNDVDLIIYPHVNDDGSFSKLSPLEVLGLIGVTEIEHEQNEYPGTVDYIYVGRREGLKIDAFFLK